MSAGARVVPYVTCLGCGCTCDDVRVTVRDGRITELDRVCEMGRQWFGDGIVSDSVHSAGTPVTLARAVEDAAALLARARRPLVYLAPQLSCEAQRAAVSLADGLGALLDSASSATNADAMLASQRRGRAAATLGEVRNRADTLLYWGVDPAVRHPRFPSRVAPEPAGLHIAGRAQRTLIAIDVGQEYGPRDADLRVRVTVDEERTALALLRTMVLGRGVDDAARNDLGRRMARVVERLAQGRYIVILHEIDVAPPPRAGRAEGLLALAESLNGSARAALCTLRAGGNRAGADAVLTWQTGFPMAVDFARGAPRYRPDAGSIHLLASGEIDAVLVAGAPAELPSPLAAPGEGVRWVVIGPRASSSPLADADVVIDTGLAGIHEGGTAFRMDEVALPLRQVITGPASATNVLRALDAAARQLRRSARP